MVQGFCERWMSTPKRMEVCNLEWFHLPGTCCCGTLTRFGGVGSALWMREGKRGGPRASPGGDVIHVHPTSICVCQRGSGLDWPERWSHYNWEMLTVSHVYDRVPRALPAVLSGTPTLLKAQLLFNGFSLAGTEHCIGESILPWVGLQQLSRRAIETCHWTMHHPSTWDKSDGPLRKCSHWATSKLVPKELLSVYKQ